MITAMSLTNGTLTIIRDNGAEILTARNDHPKWDEIVTAFKAENESLLVSLMSLKAVVENYSVGQLSINSTGVVFRGKPLHSVDVDRVMAFLRDGLPFKPLANYIARKLANPSARAIMEMYNFLEHKNMPITAEGKIIAYKGVQDDYYSKHGNTDTVVISGTVNSAGQILNTVGQVIEVERSSVDDNYQHHCSFGLHAGSLEYAKGWANRIILVEIDPADVVSIPADSQCQKLRCCKYKVVGEYTGPMPHAYAPEFDSSSEGDDEGEEPTDAPTETVVPEAVVTDEYVAFSNRVIGIIAEQLVVTINEVKMDVTLESLGMDSLDSVELVMAFEEEFGCEIMDEEAEKMAFQPVSSIIHYMYSQRARATILGVVKPDSDADEDMYLKGMQDGVRDRAECRGPKYLGGDQAGADSERHSKYIDGYVSGYA